MSLLQGYHDSRLGRLVLLIQYLIIPAHLMGVWELVLV